MNTIDTTKKYKTKSGFDVEIFKILDDTYSTPWKVLGAVILKNKTYDLTRWCTDGRSLDNSLAGYDLVEVSPYEALNIDEVSPYEALNIDDKVLVWNGSPTSTERRQRYFAGLTVDGKPTTFLSGATSWSAPKGWRTLTWDYCIKYTEGT